ncbi:ATP-binding cassette domain-containing protein [Streptomyces sp. NPDC101118]|uniref:ABC transporter permease subunit n=1 Tax=Streptomyces sp. NPDC101118 TaxID=3366109 RepID=UPI0037FAB827
MASLTYELTLAGLAVGSAAALTGIGLIVTYRATGVLNLAHGAVAMVCAYVMRQLAVEWHWPVPAAGAVTLLLVAPGIGLLLDRAVFRPLAVRGAGPDLTLVASIGVFVLLVGAAVLAWGTGARDDAPVLVGGEPWSQLAAAVLVALLVAVVTRRTRFGRSLRAVVDNRALAALGGIDADRVAAVGWAFGSFTAGLTGVLLAPYVRLDPYGLPLLVLEVVAVTVLARMRSLPVAILAALALGVAQAQLTRFHPEGWAAPLLGAVAANLFVLALLGATLLVPVPAGEVPERGAAGPVGAGGGWRVGGRAPLVWFAAGLLFLLPLGFGGDDLQTAVRVPALAVVLLSLVVVTGRGGQISLGQAAYAGLGALFTALLAAGRFPGLPAVPEPAALALAVLLVAPLGLLTGWPAIRRHGLALALATLAVGVAVSRFVFAQPYATAGLELGRPAGFAEDRAYYVLELVLLAVALVAVGALRRGRTGRGLAAMRDHPAGAGAAGVAVDRLKLGAFVVGAALAALGGGMLGMGVRAFDPEAFDPVRGLLWFAAVVVVGADSMLGALLAAALLVGLDAGARGGVAAAAIGLLATLVGRFPTGLAGLLAPAAPPPPPTTARRPGPPPPSAGAGPAPAPAAARIPAGPQPDGRAPAPRSPGTPPPEAHPDARPGRPPAPEGRGQGPGTPPPAAPAPGPAPTPRAAGPRAAGPQPVGPGPGTPEHDGARPVAHGPAGPPAEPRRAGGAAVPVPVLGSEGVRGVGRGPQGPVPAAAGAAGRVALRAEALHAHYGGYHVLRGVELVVPAGRVTGVVGSNGAGKSTLFHCLAGTLRPSGGRVLLGGRDVTRLPAYARARLGLLRSFQQPAVFGSLTVEENVRVGAEQGHRPAPRAVERALRLLDLDGPVRRAPAAGLSTGTLRRVELARALAADPRALLLDEPAAGLDTAEVEALARVLRALAADGTALLLIEHDLDLVARLADTVHRMEAGVLRPEPLPSRTPHDR